MHELKRVLAAGAAAGLALAGPALAYSPPAQDGAAQPSAVINTSRSNVKNQRAAGADGPQPTAIINTSRSNIKGQRVAGPGQGGACPADRASNDPNPGCGDAAAASPPYKLIGPRCEHAINTKGTGTTGRAAKADHAINTKGTGAAGRSAAAPDPACIAINEKGEAKDTKK